MKTECPHCHTKLKASDGYEGRKVKCSKCGRRFVIAPYSEDDSLEVCTNCGRAIQRNEQACIFKASVVCPDCDGRLRTTKQDQTHEEDGDSLDTVRSRQNVLAKVLDAVKEVKWLSFRQINKTGFFIILILMFLGILSYYRDFRVLFGWLLPWSLLMVRMFLPRGGFLRGLATWLGGLVLSIPVGMHLDIWLEKGYIPVNFGYWFNRINLILFVLLLIGIALLRFGLWPKRGIRGN